MIARDPNSAEFGPKVGDLRANCNRHVCIFGFGVSAYRIGSILIKIPSDTQMPLWQASAY